MIPPNPTSAPLPDGLFGAAAAVTESFIGQLFQYTPTPVYVTTLEERYLFVNRAWEEVTSIPRRIALGRSKAELFPPESTRRLEEINRQVAASGAPLDLQELVGKQWFRTVKFPVRDADGRVVAVGGISIDITDRKCAEEALQDYAQRLQSLSLHLLEVQEQERRRLSRELHDEIGQSLTGLRLTLERGERLGEAGLREAVGEARRLLRGLTGQVRDLSLNLRPTMLDDFGLLPALLWLLERYTAQTGVTVDFHHEGLERRFSPEGETAAYRIVQEALTNVARHAGVEAAEVRISLDRKTLRLEIMDRGAGFGAPTELAGAASCGLSGMKQRAALLGGKLHIVTAPGEGTRLTAEWPEDEREGECDGTNAARG
jgi:PAS domain S-box-containing protein